MTITNYSRINSLMSLTDNLVEHLPQVSLGARDGVEVTIPKKSNPLSGYRLVISDFNTCTLGNVRAVELYSGIGKKSALKTMIQLNENGTAEIYGRPLFVTPKMLLKRVENLLKSVKV